jgi:transposase-like protein
MKNKTGKVYRNPQKQYDEQFKRQVIEEYLRTGQSKASLRQKYDIRSQSAICLWMRDLGYTDPYQKPVNLVFSNQLILAKESKSTPVPDLTLEAKIKLLEKQLEDERLRTEMLNRMVDLAEKTYKIPVRKNFNTK